LLANAQPRLFPSDPWAPANCESQPLPTKNFQYCKQLTDPLSKETPGLSYHLFWNVNWTTSKIHILQVTNAYGWCGLGISDDGSMNGHGGENSDTFGDMWTAFWWGADTPKIIDGNSGDDFPRRDVQQDTNLIWGYYKDGWFWIEWDRKFDTGDEFDYIISPHNSTWLLWSYSNNSMRDENGTRYDYKHDYRGNLPFHWTAEEHLLGPRNKFMLIGIGVLVTVILVVLIAVAFFKLCKNPSGSSESSYLDVGKGADTGSDEDIDVQSGVLSDMATSDDSSGTN